MPKQLPPFLHGNEAHASTFVAHVAPLQPDAAGAWKCVRALGAGAAVQTRRAQLDVESQFKP